MTHADDHEAENMLLSVLTRAGIPDDVAQAALPALVRELRPRVERGYGALEAGLLVPGHAFQFDPIGFGMRNPEAAADDWAQARRDHADQVRARCRNYRMLALRGPGWESDPTPPTDQR